MSRQIDNRQKKKTKYWSEVYSHECGQKKKFIHMNGGDATNYVKLLKINWLQPSIFNILKWQLTS